VTPEPVQFRDLANPTEIFQRSFRAALDSLATDLADAPWFIREREVVNLFVFRHLVPRFLEEGLDIGQIGIEFPLPKIPEAEGEKPGSGADLVIWPHRKATLWKRCTPLARIEWKNICCREKHPSNLKKQHVDDIVFLQRNIEGAVLNFAVLTSRQDGEVTVSCKQVLLNGPENFTYISRPATGDESDLQMHRHIEELRRLAPGCPECANRHFKAATT